MALPSHKHNSTIILDMMRFMYFFHGFLGCHQHGPREFIATVDHYTHFRLGFIPIEFNYRYMTLLHKERLRACLFHILFDYLVHLYRMRLAYYFVRTVEMHSCSKRITSGLNVDKEIEL